MNLTPLLKGIGAVKISPQDLGGGEPGRMSSKDWGDRSQGGLVHTNWGYNKAAKKEEPTEV